METYEAILTRRSVPKTDPERLPDRDSILKLLRAAVRAPSHHLTQPWRFIVLTGDALKDLGAAWAAGEEKRGRDGTKVRDKALRAPVIIAVIERPKSHLPKVVDVEEHLATGGAIQNILLAAHDMGLAAMVRTGEAARLPEVRDHLGVTEDELIAAFVYLGFPPPDAPPHRLTRRTPCEEITEWRGWE